ncbi:MAG: RloB domain-containing protein [Alistipes sp.]|nr:RloB domain-containing protein [Alistipes sp.]
MVGIKNAEIILGEGITEKYYLKSLLDILTIRPRYEQVKPYNTKELEAAINQYAKDGYTTIHCLIDMDTKVRHPKAMEDYRKLKQKYDRKRVRKTNCEVRFYESFPSIEQFFYFYFESSTAQQTNDGLKSWLKHMCGYDTSLKYLRPHSLNGVFTKNGGCLRNAIANAKKSVKLREDNNFNCSYTEVGDLIEYLGIK